MPLVLGVAVASNALAQREISSQIEEIIVTAEKREQNLRVTELNPCRFISEFYDVAIDDEEQRAKVVENQCEDLVADDIADALVYCVSAPWRVNVSQLEILPTEQTYGGTQFISAPPGVDF